MERTIVGSLLRSTQAWCLQICEKETLDFGIAYTSRRFSTLAEACQFREVVVPPGRDVSRAFAETEAWFAQRALRCLRWAPAEGQSADALAEVLCRNGFRRRGLSVMSLASWVELPAAEGIRVLPARAMRAAFEASFAAAGEKQSAEAFLERLDDPQLDMFVVLCDGRPVGRGGLFQVGDLCRVVELTAAAGPRRHDVETALLGTVLGLAKRLTMRTVLVQVDGEDAAARSRWETAGFVEAGEIVEFDRIPSPSHSVSSCC